MQALGPDVFRSGGKADTPARKTSGPSAGHAAPERVFGRARKLARCKQCPGPHLARSSPTDAGARNRGRSPPLRTAPARYPTVRSGWGRELQLWLPHPSALTPLSGCMRRASRRARRLRFDFDRCASSPTSAQAPHRRSGFGTLFRARVCLSGRGQRVLNSDLNSARPNAPRQRGSATSQNRSD